MTNIGSRPRAMLLALHVLAMGALAAPAPALAMQILDAADHAELAAEISAANVNRIALAGDRIAKVVRSPDGFAVEHDAVSGDLYLRPLTAEPAAHDPVTLFIGTEKGFTYRLTLTPGARDSAQILIRNADAVPSSSAFAASLSAGEPHVAALVRLVRAVAGREPLPGTRSMPAGVRSAPASGSSRPGGARASRRSCSRPNVRHRRMRTGSRASPGPSGACRGSALLPRSGWRRRPPAPRADGSAWRWSKPPAREIRNERPRRQAPGRRRERRRRGPAAPAAAVLRHRGGRAGRGRRLARHGRRQDRRAPGRHRRRDRGPGRGRDGLDAALGGAPQQGRGCAEADGAGGGPAAHRERGAPDEAGSPDGRCVPDHRRTRRPRSKSWSGGFSRRRSPAPRKAMRRRAIPGSGVRRRRRRAAVRNSRSRRWARA